MIRNKKIRKSMQAKQLGKEIYDEHEGKSGIVLTARVHSGETVSSFMMKGAIDFLLGESREARILRKKFVFKIVPMLNPDGVRYGNYRCSLLGVDLNRRWAKPSKNLHPTIYYTKKMIEVFGEHHKILLFCDMHGHSKKNNVFMYGCAVKSLDCVIVRKNLLAKTIPVAMNKRSKFFTFRDCHFRIEKSKISTARIVLYNDFEITHSYTMEASFFGPKNKKCLSVNYHMNEKDLESVGEDLCKSCMMFASQSAYLARIRSTNDFIRAMMYRKISSLSNPTIKINYSSEDEKEDKEDKEEEEEEENEEGDNEKGSKENLKEVITKEENIKDDIVKEENLRGDNIENEEQIKYLEKKENLEEEDKNEYETDEFKEENKENVEKEYLNGKDYIEQKIISENKEVKERKGSKDMWEYTKRKIGKVKHKKNNQLRLDDEKIWEDIQIVNYSESDEEGSGGSDSCPSEKLEPIEVKQKLKKKQKAEKKKQNNKDSEIISKCEIKLEFAKSTIDTHHELKEEKLKKTYSLKPKFRVVQSRKVHSKEDSFKTSRSPGMPNLRSQNILFNYPLPLAMPQVNEKPEEIISRIQKDLTRKKSTFLNCSELNDEGQNLSFKSMIKPQNTINYSFDRQNYKKPGRDLQNGAIFSNNQSIISDFSWATTRGGYIAKNYADSARYRIDKLYSKFAL